MKKLITLLIVSLPVVAQNNLKTLKALDAVTHIKPIQQLIFGYMQQWEEKQILDAQASYVGALTYAPDGNQLVAGYGNSMIHLWDTDKQAIIQTFKGHVHGICSLKFSPDGLRLASGAHEHNMHVWDRNIGQIITKLPDHNFEVRSLSFSPDKKYIAGTSYRWIKIWDAQSSQLLHTLRGHTESINSVCFSPDTNFLAAASHDKTIRIWDTKTFNIAKTINTKSELRALAYAPDSRYLVSGSQDSRVKIWDPQTATQVETEEPLIHDDVVDSVACSPNGQFIASASSDQTVKIWHGTNFKLIQTLPGNLGGASCVAFAPNSKAVAAGCYGGYIKIFELTQPENYI